MKSLIAKISFIKIWHDPNDFSGRSILFTEGKPYNIINENHKYIIINKVIFAKKLEYENQYVYKYFYTEKETRKMKLKKINEKIENN